MIERPILVIDDSENIIIRIKEFLEKLGYQKIILAKDSQTAITEFEKMGQDGEHPIVFLDYDFQDVHGMSLLSRLLLMDADGEIIIVSSEQKDSPIITKLINEGAYEILSKPIRLENLKNILKVIESENSNEKEQDIIDLLKTTNRISETWLLENSKMSKENIEKYITKLISERIIEEIEDISDVCCPFCDSVRTGHIFSCPSCKKSDFAQTELVEHYECGTVEPEKNFVGDKCPQCKKELKALGVDHRKIKNHYTCNECGDVFAELACDFSCLKCNKVFPENKARWKSSRGFKTII
ncbi:TackOD1 domain-containing metal-binding protein [Nitrosopumilus sp. S6]